MAKVITTGFITTKVNGIEINTSYKCNVGNYTNYSSREIKYIVIHYTGNKKDTAKNNAKYFTTTGREASAHFFVDNTSIYQSVALADMAWHCGANVYYHSSCRNNNSLSIEMCCTAGNYKISSKTKKNAAYLCADLCKRVGITADTVDKYVLRHYDITHKICPAQMVGEGSNYAEWVAFKKMVKDILNEGSSSLTIGDRVKLTAGAVYYDGGKIPSWVKASKLYVRDIKKDRVVISILKKGAVTGAVNKKYLKEV